jgi:hypothetical protein
MGINIPILDTSKEVEGQKRGKNYKSNYMPGNAKA